MQATGLYKQTNTQKDIQTHTHKQHQLKKTTCINWTHITNSTWTEPPTHRKHTQHKPTKNTPSHKPKSTKTRNAGTETKHHIRLSRMLHRRFGHFWLFEKKTIWVSTQFRRWLWLCICVYACPSACECECVCVRVWVCVVCACVCVCVCERARHSPEHSTNGAPMLSAKAAAVPLSTCKQTNTHTHTKHTHKADNESARESAVLLRASRRKNFDTAQKRTKETHKKKVTKSKIK
jgi:hypothetical protein